MTAVHTREIIDERPAFWSVWSLRLALFSAALVIVGIALHRLLGLPTPTLLNMVKAGLAGAVVALVLSLAAFAHIWVAGRGGFGATLAAAFTSLALIAWPAFYMSTARNLPPINDITTDLESPPPLVALARQRGPGTNSADYPGALFAELQAAAYPDLKPFQVDRPAEEAFELAAEAVRRLKYQIVAETPPGAEPDSAGSIEAVDRTLIVGFPDDVVIRITGNQQSARIDIRSASRYGQHDFGRNAKRLREIIRELRLRLESTVPAAASPRTVRGKSKSDKAAVPRRLQGADRRKADRRSEQDRARPGAQRAPEPTARPR